MKQSIVTLAALAMLSGIVWEAEAWAVKLDEKFIAASTTVEAEIPLARGRRAGNPVYKICIIARSPLVSLDAEVRQGGRPHTIVSEERQTFTNCLLKSYRLSTIGKRREPTYCFVCAAPAISSKSKAGLR